MALQPDGKIVLGGTYYTADQASSGLVLVRLNPDGSLDDTFGSDGVVEAVVEDAGFNALAVVVPTARSWSPAPPRAATFRWAASTPTGRWTPPLAPAAGRWWMGAPAWTQG